MLAPFLEGRKERRREAHSTLEFYDYEAKNIRTCTPFSSPGTRLLLTGHFLHIIAAVPVLFSVFFGELSRTPMPLILEKRFRTLNMNFMMHITSQLPCKPPKKIISIGGLGGKSCILSFTGPV